MEPFPFSNTNAKYMPLIAEKLFFKLKSEEKQHTSCTETSVADAGIKIKKDNAQKLCCLPLIKESLLRATVGGKLNLIVTKNKLSANSSLMVVHRLTSIVQTTGRTNIRMDVEPKTCWLLIPSHLWFLPIILLCRLARSQTHICKCP